VRAPRIVCLVPSLTELLCDLGLALRPRHVIVNIDENTRETEAEALVAWRAWSPPDTARCLPCPSNSSMASRSRGSVVVPSRASAISANTPAVHT
jgi:hypothetical protein